VNREITMNRQIPVVAALALALGATACSPKSNETEGAATPAEQAATPSANPAATIPTPSDETSAPVFVEKAAASDMFEIQAAKLAQQRSKNADIKAFADMMVKDHTKSTNDMKAAIQASGQNLTPPAVLPQDKQDALNDLQNASADEFDRKYMEGQVDAHQDALNLLQRYAQDGDVDALKTFAASVAPVVQQHLDRAKSLRDALK
jgi:putative membrane protein